MVFGLFMCKYEGHLWPREFGLSISCASTLQYSVCIIQYCRNVSGCGIEVNSSL